MYHLWDADQGRLLASGLDTEAEATALAHWLVKVAARELPGAQLCLEVRGPDGEVLAWL